MGDRAGDQAEVVIHERVTVEKIDVSGDAPRHIETIILEDGKPVQADRSEEGGG